MKEPVDHIIRPRLPWRLEDSDITECGYDASKVKVLSREDFFKRLKDYGEQRTAMVTCMTCINTARRWPTWQEDPRMALAREIEWEGPRWGGSKHGDRLKVELLAIANLIEQHQNLFNASVMAMADIEKWRELKKKKASRT